MITLKEAIAYISRHSNIITDLATNGNKDAQQIINIYGMHHDCPNDPGAQGILRGIVGKFIRTTYMVKDSHLFDEWKEVEKECKSALDRIFTDGAGFVQNSGSITDCHLKEWVKDLQNDMQAIEKQLQSIKDIANKTYEELKNDNTGSD